MPDLKYPINDIWLTAAEIAALPTSGAAYTAMKAIADTVDIGTPNLSDQNQHNNVYTLAKALTYARIGGADYRTAVRSNCMAAVDTELDGRTLALGRELCAYVISAQLVVLETAEDVTFKAWLRRCLTEILDTMTLQNTQERRANNWGTMAGASRVAVAVYLADIPELDRCAQVFRGWLGDRKTYSGFEFGADLSWHPDPANPHGINPISSRIGKFSVDGALPDDMRRGVPVGGGDSFRIPPIQTGYPWEALQGALVCGEILRRQGYDCWAWGRQALRRAAKYLYWLDAQYGGWAAGGDDRGSPWLLNYEYGGTTFPTVTPTSVGKNMAWLDWSHSVDNRPSTQVQPPPVEE